ncbi:hypothetical protein SLEP1_g23885 [Rubroshorea leprosula]|uniref:Uncharacterized protein n=1 Tax=Rubroshorea leprosula TaxID=152421 RepID=A0AAV5JP69_9ROSI|nr:hypothetical protein SLEP1_g23885 [Rubroshorea leprosula]
MSTILSAVRLPSSDPSLLSYCRLGYFPAQKKQKLKVLCCSIHHLKDDRLQKVHMSQGEEQLRRRFLLFFLFSSGLSPTLSSSGKTKSKNPYDERRLLEQNKRIQKENNAPEDFPNFVREGLCCKSSNSLYSYIQHDVLLPQNHYPFFKSIVNDASNFYST